MVYHEWRNVIKAKINGVSYYLVIFSISFVASVRSIYIVRRRRPRKHLARIGSQEACVKRQDRVEKRAQEETGFRVHALGLDLQWLLRLILVNFTHACY